MESILFKSTYEKQLSDYKIIKSSAYNPRFGNVRLFKSEYEQGKLLLIEIENRIYVIPTEDLYFHPANNKFPKEAAIIPFANLVKFNTSFITNNYTNIPSNKRPLDIGTTTDNRRVLKYNPNITEIFEAYDKAFGTIKTDTCYEGIKVPNNSTIGTVKVAEDTSNFAGTIKSVFSSNPEKYKDIAIESEIEWHKSQEASKPKEVSFKEITDNLADLLEYKNKNYGNSALAPLEIFANKTKVGQRLDDKLARIKNSKELRKNDVTDFFCYLILVCKENNWVTFEEFKD